ncbi:UPF0430 protein CG31712-like isoform X4 [Tenebrio molitor]|uniref:UPF0430 protein CG31712-like isoform X4 n=1 Tax=Tenebrio molitor TaxID=7067 RepID=UPI00362478CE
MAKEFKFRLRFTTEDDLILLRDVVGHNPFKGPSKWKQIQANLLCVSGKNFSIRSVREHVEHLLKLFVKKDRANLRKSGTEEQYSEKQRLLEEVKRLSTEFKERRFGKKGVSASRAEVHTQESTTNDGDRGSEVHFDVADPLEMGDEEPVNCTPDQYSRSPTDNSPIIKEEIELESRSESPTESATGTFASVPMEVPRPKRARKSENALKNSSVEFLRQKQSADGDLAERQLRLQERRLELDERKQKLEEEKFELEKRERESRLLLEIKERENNLRIAQQQQELINFFVQNFNNKN